MLLQEGALGLGLAGRVVRLEAEELDEASREGGGGSVALRGALVPLEDGLSGAVEDEDGLYGMA